jgi:hypothetical protein
MMSAVQYSGGLPEPGVGTVRWVRRVRWVGHDAAAQQQSSLDGRVASFTKRCTNKGKRLLSPSFNLWSPSLPPSPPSIIHPSSLILFPINPDPPSPSHSLFLSLSHPLSRTLPHLIILDLSRHDTRYRSPPLQPRATNRPQPLYSHDPRDLSTTHLEPDALIHPTRSSN